MPSHAHFRALLAATGAWLALGLSAPALHEEGKPPQAPPDARLPVGINLKPLSPADRELVFVDAFLCSSPWRFTGEDGNPPAREHGGHGAEGDAAAARVRTDEHGWPLLEKGQAVFTRMFDHMQGHYPCGVYTCTWKGRGEIGFQGAARITGQGDHRLEVEVTPGRSEVVLVVSASDPEDPVRDIHIWMPGAEHARSPFYSPFLERLRPFRVIRFYQWGKIYSDSARWDERNTLGSARQTGSNGVSIEYMVDLCNELGADPWFCMPHLADDDYVRRFAELVKQRLHPDATVYVEYSNEVWNDIFPPCAWIREEAKKRGLKPPEVAADEAARDWRIWRQVFSGEQSRVVRVAAGHLHNPSVARVMAARLGDELDAIAVGAYFGARADKDGLTMESTAEEILTAARKNLHDVVLDRVADHQGLAEELSRKLGRHIGLLSYEGGQQIVARRSLAAGDQRLALAPEAAIACQVLPDMYEAYRDLLDGCQKRGMELFVGFDFVGEHTPADTFGVLQYLDEPLEAAPKYRALIRDWVTPGAAPKERTGGQR